MKIVFLDAKTIGQDVNLETFHQFGEFVTFETTSKDQIIKHIGNAQIVLTNKVVIDSEVMDKCPQLRLICITATGMNNVDLAYAAKKGIEVKNAAGYSTESVTQMTFTNVERPFFELKDKKWGIIGFGTIGKKVAKVADAFGARVSYYSTSGANNDSSYIRMELSEMMSECDIISIHAPLNEKTNGLIKKEQLSLMKKGAILLNLGRGGIVDESDLADAIDNNDILAGIDVVATEPIEADNKLLHVKKKDNLAMSPHIAWASKEARVELMKIVAQNIRDFIK